MKTVSQFLTFAILFIFAVSCDSNSNSNKEKKDKVAEQGKVLNLQSNRGTKGGQQAIARFSLDGININVEELEEFKVQTVAAGADADAMVLMRVNESLMAAEKEAQILDVNFSMSDEPVGNGMFVFGIESPDSKSITIEMFDEEGYNLAANNTFVVNEGNNYKALNVNTLDNGEYLFRLKDDQGRELARTVSIQHEK